MKKSELREMIQKELELLEGQNSGVTKSKGLAVRAEPMHSHAVELTTREYNTFVRELHPAVLELNRIAEKHGVVIKYAGFSVIEKK